MSEQEIKEAIVKLLKGKNAKEAYDLLTNLSYEIKKEAEINYIIKA